ncbi:anti-sigma-factor antagonist [Beutenbergia cavernae DSM 12333]|uniref:Anti-sigma factor antagonist n=1 Tax=Beutenbergia cavernae (strain ATCC BAA-8 / DSM 12333 / CCUG 43141 / JCM 11478 / NBRC 16432 / NCIMB 13614 / HKI 0122) TaxID=471853 RepID=C5BXZ6_BEUC1|nr:anti-sigma-factor antagonist [Beutenbergia cavernae DSM 12333]
MELTVAGTDRSGVPVVSVTGEVDVYTGPVLREELEKALARGTTGVVVDLSGVAFIDSTGLGVLVTAHRQLASRGGRLHVCAPEGKITSVIALTGLDAVLAVHSALDDAVHAAAPASA